MAHTATLPSSLDDSSTLSLLCSVLNVTNLDVKAAVALIEKSAASKEERFLSRALRTTTSVRKRLTSGVLAEVITSTFPQGHASATYLLKYVKSDAKPGSSPAAPPPPSGSAVSAEVQTYLHLLVVIHLLDSNALPQAIEAVTSLVGNLNDNPTHRSLALLSARAWFYYARVHEVASKMSDIRPTLLAAYRTATLRQNVASQAVLINCLLRNYLEFNLYDQADKLIAKAPFPAKGSNAQWARFFYYQGIIRAVQLDYTSAYDSLVQAIRKAPTQTAKGFRLAVTKFGVTVKLLTGDIPDRATFRQPDLAAHLEPYFEVTQAVRAGNLAEFKRVLEAHKGVFEADRTATLIGRLRHNVLKTGLRRINLSYSRISLKDISAKLHLESDGDAEFIVAKAIRDGVIDATIDNAAKSVQSKDIIDVYSTNDPQAAYHQRIQFCLTIHNDAVKAMRFPPDAHKKGLETPEQRAAREKDEKELIKLLEEEDDEDF